MAKPLYVFRVAKEIRDDAIYPTLAKACADLLTGTDEDRASSRLALHISCPGGSFIEALRVHDFLRQLPFPVTTIGVGRVESAACTLFLAGQRRLATPLTNFYFHGGLFRSGATYIYAEWESLFEHVIELKRQQREAIGRILNRAPDEIEDWMIRGRGFTAPQALEAGIVHEIVDEPFWKGQDVKFIEPDNKD